MKRTFNFIAKIFCVAIPLFTAFLGYSQSLPLAGGTMTGTAVGPGFVQIAAAVDVAQMATVTTTGTNYNGGATARTFSSYTFLTPYEYILVDLGLGLPVNVLSFGPWWSFDTGNTPLQYKIDYSSDNSTWTNYVTVTSNSSTNISYTPNIAARYWKLTVIAAQSGRTGSAISEFQIISNGIGSAANNLWNSPYGSAVIATNSPVDIGTLDELPSGYMLAVNGGIIATDVLVQNYVDWPDYVFKKDYALRPLSEVKAYIDQNHHLPDMPSAKEVEENGQKLGEMNKLLTKKVEELTLYLIEQNKKEKEQEKQIAQQEARLKKLEALIKSN